MTKVESGDRRPHKHTELTLTTILAPLAGAGGVGPDLRTEPDSPLAAIEEARRQDDSLDQGVWVHDRKIADWDMVVSLCQSVLSTRSKDLRIAAWLAEALVQRDGFAGIAPAFGVIEALCREFWPAIYPVIDDDGDLSARANTIALLNNRLPPALRTKPITQSGFAEPVRFSWGDYETARLYQTRGSSPNQATTTVFQDSAAATPRQILETLRDDVQSGLEAVESLDRFLDDACGRDAPSLMGLKTLLIDISAWLGAMLPPAPFSPAPEPPNAAFAGDSEMAAAAPSPLSPRDGFASGPIGSRDDAYRRLAEIADYLMRTEPHSPAPYVLRRVLGWSHMPLHEVLMEMASGRNELSAILELILSRE